MGRRTELLQYRGGEISAWVGYDIVAAKFPDGYIIDAQNRCALSAARRGDCREGCPGEEKARGRRATGTGDGAQRGRWDRGRRATRRG